MARSKRINKYVEYMTCDEISCHEIKNPEWKEVKEKLLQIDKEMITLVILHGPSEENTEMVITAKPGNYHIGIIIDEVEEYLFKGHEIDGIKVDIRGNYWANNQICKNIDDLLSIAKTFFETGKPSPYYSWSYSLEEISVDREGVYYDIFVSKTR